VKREASGEVKLEETAQEIGPMEFDNGTSDSCLQNNKNFS
jgi:hypothetical protein